VLETHARLTLPSHGLEFVSDSAAHLAEEVQVAADAVPKAMIWSFLLNGTVGFVTLITFLFCVPDVKAILSPETNPSGLPMLYVFTQASFKNCIPLIVCSAGGYGRWH
jgi:choline transport protein